MIKAKPQGFPGRERSTVAAEREGFRAADICGDSFPALVWLHGCTPAHHASLQLNPLIAHSMSLHHFFAERLLSASSFLIANLTAIGWRPAAVQFASTRHWTAPTPPSIETNLTAPQRHDDRVWLFSEMLRLHNINAVQPVS